MGRTSRRRLLGGRGIFKANSRAVVHPALRVSEGGKLINRSQIRNTRRLARSLLTRGTNLSFWAGGCSPYVDKFRYWLSMGGWVEVTCGDCSESIVGDSAREIVLLFWKRKYQSVRFKFVCTPDSWGYHWLNKHVISFVWEDWYVVYCELLLYESRTI